MIKKKLHLNTRRRNAGTEDLDEENLTIASSTSFVLWRMTAFSIVSLLLIVGAGTWGWHFIYKTPPVPTSSVIRIGISMDTLKELRWTKDEFYLTQKAHAMGASVSLFIANSDDATQVSQIENLISQKVNVLIIIAHSSAAVAPTIDEAHKAGIKVLSYDRLVLGSDADMYISFNNEQVGKNSAQYVVNGLPTNKVARVAFVGGAPTDNNATQIHVGAMEVLSPLIAAHKLQLVYDKPTDNWDPDLAYSNFHDYLSTGATVDGVVAGNDGTASGAIKALQEIGLAGKVPVTGQDAELPAIQRILAGTQTMTNYKPIKEEADKAIEIALDMAKGIKPPTNASVDNKTKLVPSFLLEPIPVTKANIQSTIIKDGFLTQKEIDVK